MTAKQLHQHCTSNVEAFGHLRIHLCVQAHLLARNILQTNTHLAGGNNECRQHHQRKQRQSPLQRKHRDQCCYQHQHVRHHAAKRARHCLLRTHNIIVQTANQCTGLRACKKSNRHVLHFVEQRHAQVVNQTFTNARRIPTLHNLQNSIGKCCHHQNNGERHNAVFVGLRDCLVHNEAKQQRRHQRQQSRHKNRDQQPNDGPLIWRCKLPHTLH